MKAFLRIFITMLLLLNGIGALFGGWHLIVHPDGSSLGLPLYILKHSPFKDFFIPGFILFVANGLGSFFVAVCVVLNVKNYPLFAIAQGCILSGWIVIQVAMIRGIHYLHVIYFTVGLLLAICGWILKLDKK